MYCDNISLLLDIALKLLVENAYKFCAVKNLNCKENKKYNLYVTYVQSWTYTSEYISWCCRSCCRKSTVKSFNLTCFIFAAFLSLVIICPCVEARGKGSFLEKELTMEPKPKPKFKCNYRLFDVVWLFFHEKYYVCYTWFNAFLVLLLYCCAF